MIGILKKLGDWRDDGRDTMGWNLLFIAVTGLATLAFLATVLGWY